MTGNLQREIRKVAVAFDPACAAPALLDTATELALFFGAELEALLVDDPDIARLSQLPFGRIFEPLSGTAEEFDSAAALSRRAGPKARARAAVRRVAELHCLTCSVRELPGLAMIDATTESDAELFVIAAFHGKFGGGRAIDTDALHTAVQSHGSVLLASQLPVKTQRILVITDESPLGERAAEIAQRIAERSPLGDASLIGRYVLDGEAMDDVTSRISSLAPTLVVIGLTDASVISELHGGLEHDAFSVLTVR